MAHKILLLYFSRPYMLGDWRSTHLTVRSQNIFSLSMYYSQIWYCHPPMCPILLYYSPHVRSLLMIRQGHSVQLKNTCCWPNSFTDCIANQVKKLCPIAAYFQCHGQCTRYLLGQAVMGFPITPIFARLKGKPNGVCMQVISVDKWSSV